jgi:hypothetical protein
MAGADRSGDNDDLLREIDRRIDRIDALSKERLDAAKELTESKFNAALNAVNVAAQATDKRFDGVNEFRQTLTDQNSTFVRTIEYNAQYKALGDKVDLLSRTNPSVAIGTVAILIGVIGALITGAIKVGSLQTQIEINTAQLALMKVNEDARLLQHAEENVERGNFQTRQTLNEKQIEQLQNDDREKLPTLQSLVERISKLEVEMKSSGGK